jgi:hypothetical protein
MGGYAIVGETFPVPSALPTDHGASFRKRSSVSLVKARSIRAHHDPQHGALWRLPVLFVLKQPLPDRHRDPSAGGGTEV